MTLKLYSYYRSSCSWRVRIALNYKNIPFDLIPVNLLDNEQASPKYNELNPSCLVPFLVCNDGFGLSQSLAIIEFLEDEYPKCNSLIPGNLRDKGRIREMALIIASDTQPIQNLRILVAVKKLAGEEAKVSWAKSWIKKGLDSFQTLVQRYNNNSAFGFSYGNSITIADLCLIPQLYNARRFGFVVEQEWPILYEIEQKLEQLPAFKASHPDSQPDSK